MLRGCEPDTRRAFLKTGGVLAFITALPVIAFAVLFLGALAREQGGWHPAPDEAVIVPIIWLGAVLLPICSWKLSRGMGRVLGFAAIGVLLAAAAGMESYWGFRRVEAERQLKSHVEAVQRQIEEEKGRVRAATSGRLAFGPVVKWNLIGDEAIDLDTSKIINSLPTELDEKRYLIKSGGIYQNAKAAFDYMKQEGLDIFYSVQDGFFAADLDLKQLAREDWEEPEGEQLAKVIPLQHAKHLSLQQLNVGATGQAIYGFRTAQGGLGILQITCLTNNKPPAAELRYKLFPHEETTPKAISSIASTPDYTQAIAALGAMSGFGDALEHALDNGDGAAAQKAIGPFLTQLRSLNSLLRGTEMELPTNLVSLYMQAGEAIQAGDMTLGKSLYTAASNAGDAWENTIPGGSYGDRLLALSRQQQDAIQTGGKLTSTSSANATTNFYIGQSYFPLGDRIEITSVERTANRMVVKGQYDLESHDSAQLTVNITSTNQSSFPQGARQSIHITKGQGDFDLVHDHPVSGMPHVSMYADGHSFAGVCFGTKQEAADSYKHNLSDYQSRNDSAKNGLTFGPVIERTLVDSKMRFKSEAERTNAMMMIDFDSGSLFSGPQSTWDANTTSQKQWMEKKGIDALCVIPEVNGLVGLDMKAVSVASSMWSEASADSIAEMLKGGRSQDTMLFRAGESLPPTWGFQTREGTMGILQITGFSDNPRGAKIRYKLVQSTGGEKATADRSSGIASATFGPVSEATLKSPDNRNAELLDLDTGNRAVNTAFGANDRETHAWIRSNRVDVLGVIEKGQIG
ncbi:MAG TPA: hypothetical protein VKA67_06105, partial [Verrucomicrobiae bacterium]|nr:hypothetical protein [Verrucomicrobiae bacterium]